MQNMYRKRIAPFFGVSVIIAILLMVVFSLKIGIGSIILSVLVWFSEPIVDRFMYRFVKGGTYE